MALKDNIKRRREELDLTLEAVAQIVGVTRATIQKYENGIISNIPSDKIEKLADVLNVSPAYLMGWSDAVTDKDGVKYYGARLTQSEIDEDDIMNYQLISNPTAQNEQPDDGKRDAKVRLLALVEDFDVKGVEDVIKIAEIVKSQRDS